MGDTVDNLRTGEKIVTRLRQWIHKLEDLERALTPKRPKLANMSKRPREAIRFAYFVLLSLFFSPLFMTIIILEKLLLFFYTLDRMDRPEKGKGPFMPSTFLKHVESGEALSRAGRKGAAANIRFQRIEERNAKILEDARKLMESGREYRELAGILVKRYAGLPGYPKTDAQYRNIMKPLREKLNEN